MKKLYLLLLLSVAITFTGCEKEKEGETGNNVKIYNAKSYFLCYYVPNEFEYELADEAFCKANGVEGKVVVRMKAMAYSESGDDVAARRLWPITGLESEQKEFAALCEKYGDTGHKVAVKYMMVLPNIHSSMAFDVQRVAITSDKDWVSGQAAVTEVSDKIVFVAQSAREAIRGGYAGCNHTEVWECWTGQLCDLAVEQKAKVSELVQKDFELLQLDDENYVGYFVVDQAPQKSGKYKLTFEVAKVGAEKSQTRVVEVEL